MKAATRTAHAAIKARIDVGDMPSAMTGASEQRPRRNGRLPGALDWRQRSVPTCGSFNRENGVFRKGSHELFEPQAALARIKPAATRLGTQALE